MSSASTTENSDNQSTDPHTAKGTSHTNTHLEVDVAAQDLIVEIRLYEDGPAGTPTFNETYEWGYGDGVDLTRQVHELDPAYAEIVVNGTEVWNGTIREYETYRITVNETAASVEYSVV